jgi:hypothetical protein
MVDRDEINERVETPKQLAKRVGITERQVRYLLQRRELGHVMTFFSFKDGEVMPRRNQGARLRWLAKWSCYYITWTERGRSRERSTGTEGSCRDAEAAPSTCRYN